MHQVGALAQELFALPQGLAHQTEFAMFQVAQTAVDDSSRPAGNAGPEFPSRVVPVELNRASSDLALTAAYGAGAFRKQRNHLAIECGDVVRLAAGDYAALIHNFLVDPGAACVAYVGLQRGPRSQCASADYVGFHQHPRTMTDRRNRLPAFEEVPRKAYGFRIHAKVVGIHYASWQ